MAHEAAGHGERLCRAGVRRWCDLLGVDSVQLVGFLTHTAPEALTNNIPPCAFGGFTASGDATINTSPGAVTVTKTNGSNSAPSATTDTTSATNFLERRTTLQESQLTAWPQFVICGPFPQSRGTGLKLCHFGRRTIWPAVKRRKTG